MGVTEFLCCAIITIIIVHNNHSHFLVYIFPHLSYFKLNRYDNLFLLLLPLLLLMKFYKLDTCFLCKSLFLSSEVLSIYPVNGIYLPPPSPCAEEEEEVKQDFLTVAQTELSFHPSHVSDYAPQGQEAWCNPRHFFAALTRRVHAPSPFTWTTI